MKLNVLVLFITASISQLHAGSFTFDNITRPAKKACDDIACVVAKHPGAIAVTTLLGGCLLIDVHHKRKNALENEEREWDYSLIKQLDSNSKSLPDTRSRSAKEMQRMLKVGAEIEQGKKELAAGTITLEQILKDIQEKTHNLTEKSVKDAIHEYIKKDEKEDDDLLFVRNYLKQKQQFTDKKAHHKFLIDAGVLIALIGIGYGIYKAYPQLIKWLSPSVK